MKLLNLNGAKIEVEAAALSIKEFADIWNSDKSKDKLEAMKLLSVVYFAADYKSNYSKYTEVEKLKALSDDILGGKSIPNTVLQAIEKYKDLQKTPTIEYLEAQIEALNKTKEYFRNIDYSERDAKGNATYKVKEVTSAMKDSAAIYDSIVKLKEKVEKEAQADSSARGGATIGQFAR